MGADAVREAQKWIDGNVDVKVLGVWARQASHKSWAIIEASDFAAVSTLLREQMLIGKTEVMPVDDSIAMRKQRGHWASS